jgi:hypothetical protein
MMIDIDEKEELEELEDSGPIVPKLKTTDIALRDTSILFWEATHKCTEDCPIRGDCPYVNNSLKCDLCYRFLSHIKDATIQALGEQDVNEFQKHMLGTGVFSLWNQFLQFEIIRISLGMNIVMSTKSGEKIHPVFAEQRKTLESIKKIYEGVFGKKEAVRFLDTELEDDYFGKALRGEQD